jgi:hypothetical protein
VSSRREVYHHVQVMLSNICFKSRPVWTFLSPMALYTGNSFISAISKTNYSSLINTGKALFGILKKRLLWFEIYSTY